jgi:tetratricopeptide (TPR) repeat protein
MEALEINSEVKAGNKLFKIKTVTGETEHLIKATILCGELVIFEKQELIKEPDGDAIKNQLSQLHREMMTEIELLYYIADKVRSINHPGSNNKLGLVFIKRNLFEEAIEQFQLAIEKQPDFLEAINNLGLAYLLTRNYSNAISTFTRGIGLNKEFADLYNNLGYCYYEILQYKSAIEMFEKAVALNPDYAEAQFNLGQTFLKVALDAVQDDSLPETKELIRRGQEHLMIAAEILPPTNIKYFDSVNECLASSELAEAFEYLDVLKNNISNRLEVDFENEFYLKFMFGGKGKDDKFITDYTEALQATIEKNPNYADLRNNLGIVYLIQCRNLFLKALDEFRKALKLNPNFKKAEKNLKLAENDGKGFLILLRAILK